jgi:dephospho-CoA kinase
MVVVGIVGLPGSGKSTVARIFQGFGAYVIDADEVGHELLSPGTGVWHKILARFGEGLLGEGGEIDRKRLADIVFSDPIKLKILNLIMHPEMGDEISRRIEGIRERDPDAVVVVDGAILVEARFSSYDKLILVCCEDKEREERLLKKGLSVEEMRKRERYQMPLERKKALADYIIDNSGDISRTEDRARRIWEEIQGLR